MFKKLGKKQKLIGSLIMASSLSACGLMYGSGPVQVDKEFYRDIAEGHLHKAADYYYLGNMPKTGKKEFIAESEDKINMGLEVYQAGIKAEGGLRHIKLIHTEVSADGKEATVKLELMFNNGKSRMVQDKLLKINGKWLIAS